MFFPALGFPLRYALQLPLFSFFVFLLPLGLLSFFNFGSASLCCTSGVLGESTQCCTKQSSFPTTLSAFWNRG
jgi:hypothetical protein